MTREDADKAKLSAAAEAAQWQAALPTFIAQLLAGLGETWAPLAASKLAAPAADGSAPQAWGAAVLPSWGAAGLLLGAALHCLLADRWGRRRTLMLIPAVAAVNGVQSYALGGVRATAVLWGACSGVGLTTSYVYLAEIAGAGLRGRLCCTALAFHSLGRLYVRALGPALPLHTLGLLPLPFAGLAWLLVQYAPDTPYHHAAHRRPAHMLLALARLRGDDTLAPHVRAEAVAIMDRVGAQQASPSRRWLTRGCVVVLVLVGTLPLSGVTVLNAQPLLLRGEATSPTTSPTNSTTTNTPEALAVQAVVAQLAAQLAAAAVVDGAAGRRGLLLASSCSVAASASLTAILLLAEATTVPAWLPAALQLCHGAGVYLGAGTVAFIYLGELLPLRSAAVVPAATAALFAATHAGVAAATLPPWALCLSAALWAAVLAAAVLVGLLPETRGVALHSPSLVWASRRRPSRVLHL